MVKKIFVCASALLLSTAFAVPASAVKLGDPSITVADGGVMQVVDASNNKFELTSAGMRFLRTGGAFLDNFIQGATTNFRMSSTGLGSRDVTALSLQADGDVAIPTGNVGIGTSSPTAKLHVLGTAKVNVLEITGGSDLSETFDINGASAVPGMVLSIDPQVPGQLAVCTEAYDRKVAGIVSGANGLSTGMRMGQAGSVADGAHPVALTGRVYCLVDATEAAIQPGDLLTTSATSGHAMKVLDYQRAQGAIIGKAMTALAQGEKGMVLVLVSLQ